MSALTLNLDKRLDDIKKKIASKTAEGNEQKENIKTIQKNLAKSHEITLRLVIDVSRLLKKYQDYFDKLDEQIKTVNVGFSKDESKFLSAFADTSITDLTNSFEKHINFLKRYYVVNGLENTNEMSRLRALENLHSTLVTDVKYVDSMATDKKIPTATTSTTSTSSTSNVKSQEPTTLSKWLFGGEIPQKSKNKKVKTKNKKPKTKSKK